MRFSVSQAEIRRFIEQACAMERSPAFALISDRYGDLNIYHRWYSLQSYDIDLILAVEVYDLEEIGVIHEDKEDPDVWDFTEDDDVWRGLFNWLEECLEYYYPDVLSEDVTLLRAYNAVFGEDDRYSFGISR